MNPADITLLLGVDARHLEELRLVWPTWIKFKPELLAMPCVVFFDPSEICPSDLKFMSSAISLRLVPWELRNSGSQREKMLTGFIHVAASEVRTRWYLKIDTDVVAINGEKWIHDEWFQPDSSGSYPVFIASPWSYSKPRYAMDVLDDWGDAMQVFRGFPRLNIPYSSESTKIKHKRIISWLFFGRTDWTKEMSDVLGGCNARLPIPSQDGFMFYCAERTGAHYLKVKMSRFGWSHQRLPKIRETIANMEKGIDESMLSIETSTTGTKSEGLESQGQGVVYYNVGTGCAARLLVSLYSLRKYYSGSVTILSEGDDSHLICRKIAAVVGAEVREWNCDIPEGSNRAYLAKTKYFLGTPYNITLALDSDTLIVGPIDELFETIEKHSFCVAQIADWRSYGRGISKRIRQWKSIFPDLIGPALSFGPAINCGVVGFTRNYELCRDWYDHAILGRENFIPDEVSCQILLHRYTHYVLDGRWNRSCKHDNPYASDTRIIHYHGRKHCRPGLPFGAERWVSVFTQVYDENLAEIHDWLPAGDRTLKKFLNTSRSHENLVTNAKTAADNVEHLRDSQVKIVLGAGRTNLNGWISTDRNRLDVTVERDFQRLLKGGLAKRFLAEHVWEHLPSKGLREATCLVYKYLEPGGVFRIAVPDGLNPDPDYILRVQPGGSGPAAHDHKHLFTHVTLASMLEGVGFHVRKLEYWDEESVFRMVHWDSSDGKIKRSALNDRRNRHGKLCYTSLILDAVKPE